MRVLRRSTGALWRTRSRTFSRSRTNSTPPNSSLLAGRAGVRTPWPAPPTCHGVLPESSRQLMRLAYSRQHTQPPLCARLGYLDDQLVDAGGRIRLERMRRALGVYGGAQHHTKPG